ncbi:hypothetical protein JW921_10940 [Candidatus Fermentibacterales bacterium]|nr:hypothetical protein [Candidatus Fermentibacterales bacterium]
MSPALPLAAGGLLLFVLALAVVRVLLRRRTAAMIERFGGSEIVMVSPGASFFGLESRGMGQVRGNGVLLLTSGQLCFEMLLPRRVFTIPLETVTGVQIVKSHLGKSRACPLLKVSFAGPAGPDSAAWALGNPEEWVGAISGRLP